MPYQSAEEFELEVLRNKELLNKDPIAFNQAIALAEEESKDALGGFSSGEFYKSQGRAADTDVESQMDAFDQAYSPHRTKEEWKALLRAFESPAKLDLKDHYEKEKNDSKHRMGDLLMLSQKIWQMTNPAVEFMTWLDGMPEFERVIMLSSRARVMKLNSNVDGNLSPAMVKAFLKGVKYLDQAGRKKHRVKFVAGTAMQNSVPFSTLDMQTFFTGRGFGIWVMSSEGKMYAGNHVRGQFHHSSFLAGGSVMCGGEVCADKGKIMYLSAKTGHYKAQIENFIWALQVLQVSLDHFDSIKVLVWNNSKPTVIPATALRFGGNFSSWGDPLSPAQEQAIKSRQFDKYPS